MGRALKSVPVDLLPNLVPKTEPTMLATMSRVVNKQIGMINLFLRYQERLLSVMEKNG